MNRSTNALQDTLLNMEKEARRRDLLVNENKTKYVQVARAVHNDEHLWCGQHNDEHLCFGQHNDEHLCCGQHNDEHLCCGQHNDEHLSCGQHNDEHLSCGQHNDEHLCCGQHNAEHLCCGQHKFEHVKEISYLSSQTNQTNSISIEIQVRILSGNRCYYAYGKLMKSRALNRSSKLKIHKSLMRPVVTYGCEAWTLTNRDKRHLRICERRILRKVFGPMQNKDGSWRIRMSYELNELIEKADIVRFIKCRRIAWLAHVMRMDYHPSASHDLAT